MAASCPEASVVVVGCAHHLGSRDASLPQQFVKALLIVLADHFLEQGVSEYFDRMDTCGMRSPLASLSRHSAESVQHVRQALRRPMASNELRATEPDALRRKTICDTT